MAKRRPWQRFATNLAWLSSLLLCFLGLSLNASPLPALDATDVKARPLGAQMAYYIDHSGQIDIDTLIALDHNMDWAVSDEAIPNLGLTSMPVWFGMRLSSAEDIRRLLHIAYPPLDWLDIYLVQGDRIVEQVQSGDQRLFSTRPIHHRDFLLPLQLEAGVEYRLFIRVETQGALQLPVTLWEAHEFLEHTQHSFAFQLLFLGIMAALAIYNLLLCFVVRDRAYLWYVVYLASFFWAQLTLRGIGFQYLWPEWPALNNFLLPLLLSVSLAAVGFFTHSFLDARRYSRFWSATILSVGWVGVLLTGASLVMPYNVLISLLLVAVSAGAAIAFSTGCYLWWKGQPLARLYVIAWSAFLLGNVLFNLEKAGLLPFSSFAEHTVQVGTIVQMLLLSFALAQRINLERQQRQKAQERALTIQREATERLEQNVAERTEQLREAYEQLKEISQLDGLTQLKNRQFFDQALEKEWRRNTRESREISLLMLDVDHFKAINDAQGHLCGDACLRHLAELCQQQVHRAHDVVARYGGEEFVILLPCTDLQGAAIVAENIRESIKHAGFRWEGQMIPLTASVGIASCIPSQSMDIDWLVRNADQALYTAKHRGRDRTMVYGDDPATITPVEAVIASR